MSLLDGVKAAVLGTAAARAGYLQGEDVGEEKQRRRKAEDEATERQSRLDQMKARLDAATMERERAQADYYRRRPAPGTSTSTAAPKTITADEGIMRWDPDQKKFVPTGLHPPERATDRAAARTAAKEKQQGTKDALSGVQQQIANTRTEMHDAQSDMSIGDDELPSRLQGLRQRLDSLSGVSDSLNAVMKGGRPGPVKRAITKDQAAYLKTTKGMTDAQINARYRVTP